MTRVQDEYDVANESHLVDYKKFHLKPHHLKILKETCTIMHPMPRRDELDPLIDKDPRAIYWRQERNGMWIRVALMTMIFGVDRMILLPEL
jgi:aspartate carbamoyltransferase catalytic subunit